MKFGSVCSGIEAASVAFKPLGFKASWFSEIAELPSKLLKYHYPTIKNQGDMNDLPELISEGKIDAPDILCGGTPCQAFSLAGWKTGLIDKRGQLTLKFIEVADAIDSVRLSKSENSSIILWENVEGVLNDKTNAFGIFIAGLAGFDTPIEIKKWSSAGILKGPKRNIAWRVLDAKYFGLPQQRRRLFVIATGKNLNPENILFELHNETNKNILNNKKVRKIQNTSESLFPDFIETQKQPNLVFKKNNNNIEFFREYTDCLYSAYGTKWNGNAAAYNGSLFISQNDRIRRFTPLECERLMGFPDNYTLVPGCSDTNRYQAVGNSWAVPVVRWVGERIKNIEKDCNNDKNISNYLGSISKNSEGNDKGFQLFFENDIFINNNLYLNVSPAPNNAFTNSLIDIVDVEAQEKFYLSESGRLGILRRKTEKNMKMNNRLEELLFSNLKIKEKILA